MPRVKIQPAPTVERVSDNVLLQSALLGDAAACEALWHRYRRMAFHVTQRITKDFADAEDALQDCFLKTFSRLHTFDGRAAFSTWVTSIAINSALMVLRRRRSRANNTVSLSDDFADAPRWEPTDQRSDPERDYLREEGRKRLRKAVSQLRPRLKAVVEIQLKQDGCIADIAGSTGLTESAVKSRLLRARTELRGMLEAG